ncbi:hypothetical protein ACFSHQ_05030 [Gemmobacter lanyuensis]
MAGSYYALTVAGFLLAYVAVVGLSLPGATVFTLAGGFMFGVFPGVVFNVVAATTGACLIFLAARSGFGARLSARLAQGAGLRPGCRPHCNGMNCRSC